MTIKKSEHSRDLVVRIREVSGQSAAATIAFPGFRTVSARSAMMTEEPLGPALVFDNEIHARLAPFAIQTFLVDLVREEGVGYDA
jgi:alpha-mannosidase